MPRDLGGISPLWTRDPNVFRAYFIKMEFPIVGTKYWTTKQTYPLDTYTVDLGEGSIAWDGTHAWEPGDLEQGEQTTLTISQLTFGNEANEFSDLMYLAGGICGVPITVWMAGFTNAPPHDPVGDFILFQGEGDRDEVGDQVKVSLLPFKHPMLFSFPRRRFTPAHGFYWIPPPNFKVQWGSGNYSAPTASPRQTGSPADSGGSLLIPGQRMPVVRPGGSPGTRTVGPRAGGGGGTVVVHR